MKYWFEKNYKTLIIAAFLVPIITVAIVSISHVTKWYGLSNPVSWAAYLSVGIEIAALSALAAISANMGKKVYFPFAIVTIVQFIGNIYFAYSYIDIDTKEFKDWVGLVSPLVEFMGVDPTDFSGHKRFLAFFAGGMLPLISLSFLHMLVKFTEEDKAIEDAKINAEPSPNEVIDAKDIIGEVSRVRLSDEDLAILQNALLNPQPPNEELVEAAKRYEEIVTSTPDQEIVSDLEPEQTNDFQEEPVIEEEVLVFSTMDPIITNNFQENENVIIEDEFIPEPVIVNEEPEQVIVEEPTIVNEVSEEVIIEEPIIVNEETEQVTIEEPIFSEEQIIIEEPVINEDLVIVNEEFSENVEKTQLEKLIEHFTPEPEVTPEELEQYQNEQDIEELIEDPIWDLNQDTFGDDFDLIQQEPVIEKVNIEEFQTPVENIVMEDTFNYQDTNNDVWRQYGIEQIDDQDDEDLKKKI
jgi:hypothetical protein